MKPEAFVYFYFNVVIKINLLKFEQPNMVRKRCNFQFLTEKVNPALSIFLTE